MNFLHLSQPASHRVLPKIAVRDMSSRAKRGDLIYFAQDRHAPGGARDDRGKAGLTAILGIILIILILGIRTYCHQQDNSRVIPVHN